MPVNPNFFIIFTYKVEELDLINNYKYMHPKTTVSLKIVALFLLTIYFQKINSQVDAGNDTITCTGARTIYAIPAGGYWTTSGGATIVSPSVSSTLVTDLDPGANLFTYTVSGIGNDDVAITNNQVYADAGADRNNSCLDYVDLEGNPIPIGGVGEWSLKYITPGVILDNTASNLTQAHNLPFGNTFFQWTVNANGCSATDEVSINNNTPENNDDTDKSACSDVFYIGAETPPAGGYGLWSIAPGSPNNPVFDDPLNHNVEVTVPRGSSIARWTITYNGCTSFKDFSIVNNLPNPIAGLSQDVCRDTVILDATAPLTGEQALWTVIDPQGEIFSSTSVSNPMVINLKQGTTTFQWTLSNGLCAQADFVQIGNNRPDIYAGPDVTICENNFTLSADNPGLNTGTWSCSDPSVIFNDIHSNQALVSNLVNNSYTLTWTVTNGICTAKDNLLIHTDYVPITAGVNKSDCADTLILSATAIPPGGSGYWSITFGDGTFDNSLSNNTVARNISRISHFKWTIISGSCTFNNEIEYTNQLSSIAVTQADKAVCTNQTLITANPPVDANESGIWSKVDPLNSSVIANPALFQTQVSNLEPGINIFQWTIQNQYCSNSDIIQVTNNEITTNAGSDETICNDTYNLNAFNAGGTGYWTSSVAGPVFSDSTSPLSAVANLEFGPNALQWTRTDLGCNAIDEVVINNQLPENVFAGIDLIVCENTANLSADNPPVGSGVWSLISGSGSFANPNLYQTQVSGISLGPNVYRWTVTNLTCTDFDDVLISNNKIVLNAGNDQVICNQPVANLNGTAPSVGQTGVWSVIGGNGVFSNATLYNSDVSATIKGINTYQWTLTDEYCTNSSQVVVTDNTPDSAKVGVDQIICVNNSTINAIAVTNGTGQWSLISGGGSILNVNQNNTAVSSIPEGTSTYRWTVTKNACSLSDEINIVNNTVIADIPAIELSVCDPSNTGSLLAVQPIPGSTGIWTKVSLGTGIISDPSSYTTVVSNLGNGETRFRWTVTNATCSAWDETSLINDYYSANAGPVGPANLCVDYGPVLGTLPPASGNGLWTADNPSISFTNSSLSATTVQNLPLGSSTLYWKITNNGCSSQANFILNNYSLTTNAGKDTTGCSSTTLLNAKSLEAGQTGYWTSNYAAVVFSNSADPNSQASNIPMGTSLFTWTINANGCTASDNLVVTNYSFNVSAGNDRVICGTDYGLTGSDPLSTGNGNWSVTEGTGIIANPTAYNTLASNLSNGSNIFRWTVQRNGCSAFDEVSITNDLYLAQASAPSNVCVDEVPVSATAIPPVSGASASWSTLYGGGVFDDYNAASTTTRNLALGLNRFRWTVSKGTCISYVDIEVQNNRLSLTAGPDQVTCITNASLFGTPLSPTGTGEWTSINPAIIISNPGNASTDVSNLERGANILTWTINDKGCTDNASITITNNDFDATAGNDQMVTIETAFMNAALPVGGATGQWIILNGFGIFYDINNPVTETSNLGYGINTFRWIVNSNGCIAYDDVNITYNVAESYAGTDQLNCSSFTNLMADIPLLGTGSWSVVSGNGIFQDPAAHNTLVTNINPGINIYRWTVNAYGITATDDVSITNNSFSTFAGFDQQTCSNEVFLDAQALAAGGSGFWTIMQGSGTVENNFSNQTKVSNLMVGSNCFIWEVQNNGCSSKDTVLITHYQPASVSNAGADAIVCNSNTYLLSGNSPAYGTGLWSTNVPGVSFLNTGQFNTPVSNLQDGDNMLKWTISTANCISEDDVIVSVRKTISVISQPLSQEINEGSNISFNIVTSGDVQNYQWQKDGLNLINDGRVTGVNSANLNIAASTSGDAGVYRCLVTGYCNTVNSESASLSVISGFEDLYKDKITIYPNPTKGQIKIEFKNDLKPMNFSVLNLNGEKILYKKQLNNIETIDLTAYADGVYFIIIQFNNGLIKSRIVLQK